MAVDDLWYLARRDPETGERRPTKRHGRGKRWRVRWNDPRTGETRTELFERKADAERHDVSMHADISRGQYIDPRAGKITIVEYAAQWRTHQLHRDSTADMVERAFRLHILPVLGHVPIADARASNIRAWVKATVENLSASTLHVVYSYVRSMFAAAAIDKIIALSPCVGIRLPETQYREFFILEPGQIHRLVEEISDRYSPIPYLPAGCGCAGVRSSVLSWTRLTS